MSNTFFMIGIVCNYRLLFLDLNLLTAVLLFEDLLVLFDLGFLYFYILYRRTLERFLYSRLGKLGGLLELESRKSLVCIKCV